MPISFTERGFANYADFEDSYGAKVIVRESSADPLDKVWIFVNDGAITNNKGSAHLNVEQAKTLRDALDEWIRSQDETLKTEGS